MANLCAMSVLEFEVYEDAAGEWRWRLRAGNGETVCQGEGYTRKADARRGAKDMAKNVFIAMAKLLNEEGDEIDLARWVMEQGDRADART